MKTMHTRRKVRRWSTLGWRRLLRSCICAAAGWALGGDPGVARAQPEQPPPIVNERYRLPNGLRVILSRDARTPRVALSVWYRAGLRHEPTTQPGLLSLVEQAMFSGSKHVGDGEHLGRLRRAGATDVGANVGLDHSSYHETVPSNYLEMVLWLESDRMRSLQTTTSAGGLTELSSMSARTQSLRAPTIFGEAAIALPAWPHPSCAHPSPLRRRRARAAGSAQCRHCERCSRSYIPANATLAVVGDFDPLWAKKAIAKYFGALRGGRGPAPLLYAPVQRAPALVSQLLGDGGPPVVSWHTQSPGALTQRDAAAHVLAKLLAAGSASRLHRELVGTSQLAHSVFAEQHSAGTHSQFVISAIALPGITSVPLQSGLARALANVCARPFSTLEVERAKLRAETDLVIETQTLSGLAERLQFYDLYADAPDYLARELAHYEALQPHDVQQLATELLCAPKTP